MEVKSYNQRQSKVVGKTFKRLTTIFAVSGWVFLGIIVLRTQWFIELMMKLTDG